MAIFLYKDITNTQGTAENFSTGELYDASFDLRKFDKKSLSKDHYAVTSLNHRLKVGHAVSVYDRFSYHGV